MGDYDDYCKDCPHIGGCDNVGCALELDDQEAAYEESCEPGLCVLDENELCCDCGDCHTQKRQVE